MTKESLDEIRKQMGYTDAQKRCKTCRHFVPENRVDWGAAGECHAHCTLNLATKQELEVEEGGVCDFHEPKTGVCLKA